MKQLSTVFLLVISIIAFFACEKDNSLEQLRQNELKLLDEYILKNHPGAIPNPSGLYYFESIKGSGDTVRQGDRVQVFYATWTLKDSVLIDESSGYTQGHRFEPLEFVVGAGEVIAGLDEAATYMQLGTKANLVIPSEIAYGQQGSGSVGGFTTLLMEVEMYKVYPLPVIEEEK